MKLDKEQLNKLVRLVAQTREDEIDCGQCLDLLAEFAERELSGKPLDAGLKAVEHHLSVCNECCEEYEVLKAALKTLDE